HDLDALVAPTGGPAWLTDLVNGDGGTASAPGPSTVTAVAGYPHITVPAGYVAGLPIGISFFGRAWSEPTLIKIAYAYEQATKHRQAPRFLTTLNGAPTGLNHKDTKTQRKAEHGPVAKGLLRAARTDGACCTE